MSFLSAWRERGERKRAARMCDEAIAYLVREAPDHGGAVDLGTSRPLVRAVGHGLVETYVVDAGDHLEHVQSRHLELAKMDPQAFRAQCLSNLFGYVHANQRHLEIVRQDRVLAAVGGGGVEASLFLSDDFWDSVVEDELGSAPLAVAIPARDVLGFCDARDAQAKKQLRDVIERVWSAADPATLLSREVFVRVDGCWHPEPT